MSLVTPDFSEIQEEIKPGTYKARIRKGDIKAWPSGDSYVNWELETYGESDPKNNGRRTFYKTNVSGKSAFILQRFYKAAMGQPLTGQFDTESLVGRQVEIEVVDGVKNGVPTGYTDVKTVRPITGN